MKYCVDGNIDISVTFDGLTANQLYKISVSVIMNKNIQYNEEPLLLLLGSENKNVSLGDQLTRNYMEYFELISHFGIGMIVFPGIVQSMDGVYSIESIDPSEEEQKDEQKGEQDQAHPAEPKGKLKITFTVPLSQAAFDVRIRSPYLVLNTNKKSTGSTHTWLSPFLAPSKCLTK